MEEEIITPEEETFDYNKLRYILDNKGYIIHASFGGLISCNLGECTEYTGDIPGDYESIEEWYDKEIDKLNAWKVVEGNLVFDENKYNELLSQWQIEAEENCCASKKYVKDSIKSVSTFSSLNEMLPIKKAEGIITTIPDANDSKIKQIDICKHSNGSFTGKVRLYIHGKNLLINEAISTTNNGIEYKINPDKSIDINGTATANSEIVLCGTSTSLDVLFILKKNIKYYLNCGQTITLYSFDGTNRTLVYEGAEGIIELEEDVPITQVVLNIPNETVIKDLTIYPQIEVGETFTGYEKGNKANTVLIDLEENILERIGLFPDDNLFPADDLYPIDDVRDLITLKEDKCYFYKKVNGDIEQKAKEIDLNGEENPSTFYGSNTIYTDKDLLLIIQYSRNNYYDIAEGTNILHLKDTYESEGAINRLEITGFEGTETNIEIISSKDGTKEDGSIVLKLDEAIGLNTKVVIENGKAIVIKEDGNEVEIENIYIKTFDNETYIFVKDIINLSYIANYMLKSTFTEYFCTKTEKNASIKVTEDEIRMEVSKTYATKETLDETEENLKNEVIELSSTISQTAEEINLEVSKKVGNNEVISKINQTAEDITIDANRININGTVSANGNFKVDTKGNMECSNAKFNGGNIDLINPGGVQALRYFADESKDTNHMSYMTEDVIAINNDTAHIEMACIDGPSINVYVEKESGTYILHTGIRTPLLTQTSLESIKKNFEKVEDATSIVKNADIYKYNFKTEEDTDKKHYGFVIGENYNTPDEVISKTGDGIDTYSMVSILWKAVQEQQEQIELNKEQIKLLQEEINKLKGEQ